MIVFITLQQHFYRISWMRSHKAINRSNKWRGKDFLTHQPVCDPHHLSHLAPYNQMVWSKNLCKVFGIDFHFNLNFGKHGSEVNKRIHNSDTDAGIVPTTK